MHISVLYFADCPNWREAGQRLRQALDQVGLTETQIDFVPVETEAEAAVVGFRGSPTFTVDGEDLFGDVAPGGALSCRVYAIASGLAGVPAVSDLVAALRERGATDDAAGRNRYHV